MAVTTDVIQVVFNIETAEALKKFEQIKGMAAKIPGLKAMGADTKKFEQQLLQTAGASEHLRQAITIGMQEGSNAMEMAAKKADQMAKRFDMNALSFLFAGYAMQRLGMSITRFMLPSQEMLNDNTLQSTKLTNSLAASFQYLKFTIAETLANSQLFTGLIDFVIGFNDNMADLVEKYPIITQIAMMLGLAAIAAGSIAIARGVIGQFDHVAKLLTGGAAGGIVGAIRLSAIGLGAWAISSALSITLILIAAALALIYANSEEAREEFKLMSSESVSGFTRMLNSLLNVFDASVDLDDTWRYMGASITWLTSLFFVGFDGVVAFLETVIITVDNLLDRIAAVGASLYFISRGEFGNVSGVWDMFSERQAGRESKLSDAWDRVFNSQAIVNAESGIQGILDKWNAQRDAADQLATVIEDDLTPANNDLDVAMESVIQSITTANSETNQLINTQYQEIDVSKNQKAIVDSMTASYNNLTKAVQAANRAMASGSSFGGSNRAFSSSVSSSG